MDPSKQHPNIVVQIIKEFENIDVDLPRLKRLIRTVCDRFKLPKTTVSVAIVGDGQIRKLNKQFLNCNSTTDCLSFDLSDDDAKSFDLIVNAEMAVREANTRGHSAEAELALYIAHGLLHNLGFDDSKKAQAGKMHLTEDEILQKLGYGLVYNNSCQ